MASILSFAAPLQADPSEIMIPDIGTAGALGLSIQREQAIGEYFMRVVHSELRVLTDPVMQEYISTLGGRLVNNADHVRFPFDFFLVRDPALNAFAFVGGKVAVNTGLFYYAKTEDEFASVLAHEISHVTQRHIARYLEKIINVRNVSVVSMIGAIALAVINPAVGMAMANTVMGATMQAGIHFTRENESEADRIGIDLLQRSGFSPEGMVTMFRQMYAMQGNINPAFTLLIDHPLSDERMADAASRAALYPKTAFSKNPEYDYARARVAVRFSGETDMEELKKRFLHNADKNSNFYKEYGLALVCYELGQLDEARQHLKNLGSSQQKKLFLLDLYTDIDIKDGKSSSAIQRLLPLYKQTPKNQVVAMNIVSAYMSQKSKAGDKHALEILDNYLRYKPKDLLALDLSIDLYERRRDKCNVLQTRGEILALQGAYAPAIGMYNKALSSCLDMMTRERIRARVGQIVTQRALDEELIQKGF